MTRKSTLLALLLASGFALGTAAEAQAWTRSGSVTGPRGGTATYGGSGSCAKGQGCAWKGGGTGPAGRTWSRTGSIRR